MYTNEEEKLLSVFRRLSPAGKKELLGHAEALLPAATPAAQEPPDRCCVKTDPSRPEAADEPLVTE